MTNIAVVTDSTCDMPASWPGWQRGHTIPIHIRFGDESFREGIDIDEAIFYARVASEHAIPQTSQPSPGEFAELYRRLSDEYDAIISMHVTGALSGTYQSAVLAAEMVKDVIEVHPVDSSCGSMGLGFMADEAFALIDENQPVSQILARMDVIRKSMNIFLSPDTLEYAHLSGRVSTLGSAVASLLQLKPIIVLHDGKLSADERVRTRKRAMLRMVEMMRERVGDFPARVGVAHAQADADAEQLAALAEESLHCLGGVQVAPLATSVAVHLGPGTIGLVAYAA
ncbi:MAG: DegV family protein [Caldilineales bacterium]|nr:DegV family protein [Caldilineales bacterium]